MRSKQIFAGFVVSVILGLLVPLVPSAYAVTAYFFPQGVELSPEETAILEIRIDTEGETLNAIELSGAVSSNIAEIIGLDTSNSLIKIFVEQSLTGEQSFKVVGGTPNGFNGNDVVGRLTVRAKTAGQTSLVFEGTPRAVLNTAGGAETPVKAASATISIREKGAEANYIPLTSQSHPNQDLWYNSGELSLHWDLEPNIEYSYLVSLDAAAVPDDAADRPEGDLIWMGDISVSGLQNGVYYFTVKKVGADEVSRYRAMIDTVSPNWVDAQLDLGTETTGERPFLSFLAEDSLSGVDRYEVQIDDQKMERAESPYILPYQYKKIILVAYDRAGNSVERIFFPEHKPLTATSIIVGLTVVLVALILFLFGGKIGFLRKK